jgi:hypothetical protein
MVLSVNLFGKTWWPADKGVFAAGEVKCWGIFPHDGKMPHFKKSRFSEQGREGDSSLRHYCPS